MQEMLNNPYVIKGLLSLSLAVVVMVLAKIALSIAKRKSRQTAETPFVIKYAALCFFAVSLVVIWLDGIGPILTALTIVAAALTIVSKELILNFLGSFVIFWREIFAIGDRVEIGDHSGDVIDKGLFYFTLLETGRNGSTDHSTGRLIKVPNSLVMTQPVVNATRGAGYVWTEMHMVLTRTSDRGRVRDRLLELVNQYYESEKIDLDRIKRVFEQRRIFFNRLTPRCYVDLANGGVRLTLRYLCRSRMTRDSRDYILTRFLPEIEELGAELAEEQS